MALRKKELREEFMEKREVLMGILDKQKGLNIVFPNAVRRSSRLGKEVTRNWRV